MVGAVGVALAVGVLGCGSAGRYRGAVRRQHAALYGCAENEVDARSVAARTWAAEGCGRRAIYICRRGAVCAQQGETTRAGADEISAQEAALARRRDEQSAQARANARVRAEPRAPDLNSTQAEAELICRQQGGTVVVIDSGDGGLGVSCTLDGRRIFAAHVAPRTVALDQVDTWIEGGDIAAIRDRFERRFGPSTLSYDDRQMRVWTWQRPTETWVVRQYQRGVWVTGMQGSR